MSDFKAQFVVATMPALMMILGVSLGRAHDAWKAYRKRKRFERNYAAFVNRCDEMNEQINGVPRP